MTKRPLLAFVYVCLMLLLAAVIYADVRSALENTGNATMLSRWLMGVRIASEIYALLVVTAATQKQQPTQPRNPT